MQERVVKVVFGDWSDDGHGKTDTKLVRLRGRDVSDETLEASYCAATEAFGKDLATVCESYEEYTISEDFYEKLAEAGFEPATDKDYYPSISVADYAGEETFFGAIELLMFYTGFQVEDFSWEEVEDEVPTLLGGWGTILKQKSRWGNREELTDTTSFGYGLFH